MSSDFAPAIIRYSPRPRSSYVKTVGAHSFGPATSTLLDSPETWNLAFLSHDYETSVDHPDPNFTTHVRRTTQTRLDGTGLDIGGDPEILVASLLLLPAPRFVFLIRNYRALSTLPLFQVYGEKWLTTIEERAKLCESGEALVVDVPTEQQGGTVSYQLLARLQSSLK